MAKNKGIGSVKRYGPRYGRRVKHKLAKIEAVQKGKQKCPYCSAERVKRLSTGIWICRKCDSKFTGKAYSIKKIIIKEEEEKAPESKAEEEVAK
jgi:large subunit ribosomal protein L37Ae